MKNVALLWIVIMITGNIGIAQNVQAFQIFNEKGKKSKFQKMAKDAEKSRVVLFGEVHNDPITHWLQLKLTQHLHGAADTLVLGAEMFERDAQTALSAYVLQKIDHDEFIDTVPSVWNNYETDYRPLVDFARVNGLDFIATNVPRYLASAVYRGGFEVLDTISELEKSWLPPLPLLYDPELPGYQAMLEMGGGHAGENFPRAQAIKDAVMGWHIAQNIPESGTFLHFNGTYHSNNFEGIYWYIQQYSPDMKPLTIAVVRQKDVSELEDENKEIADYILVVDDDMTTTY